MSQLVFTSNAHKYARNEEINTVFNITVSWFSVLITYYGDSIITCLTAYLQVMYQCQVFSQ